MEGQCIQRVTVVKNGYPRGREILALKHVYSIIGKVTGTGNLGKDGCKYVHRLVKTKKNYVLKRTRKKSAETKKKRRPIIASNSSVSTSLTRGGAFKNGCFSSIARRGCAESKQMVSEF